MRSEVHEQVGVIQSYKLNVQHNTRNTTIPLLFLVVVKKGSPPVYIKYSDLKKNHPQLLITYLEQKLVILAHNQKQHSKQAKESSMQRQDQRLLQSHSLNRRQASANMQSLNQLERNILQSNISFSSQFNLEQLVLSDTKEVLISANVARRSSKQEESIIKPTKKLLSNDYETVEQAVNDCKIEKEEKHLDYYQQTLQSYELIYDSLVFPAVFEFDQQIFRGGDIYDDNNYIYVDRSLKRKKKRPKKKRNNGEQDQQYEYSHKSRRSSRNKLK